MKICLTGIPGSGKTALAHSLRRHFGDEGVLVVDEYAESASDNIDLAVGFEGSYLSNINVALERVRCERLARSETVITCGSLMETSSYFAMDIEARQRFWKTDEQKAENGRRIQATMAMLACLYMDTFRYDKVYYLPPFAAVEDSRMGVLDRNLQAAFQAFGLAAVVPLSAEGATLKEVTDHRIELIKKESDEASSSDEPRVRPGDSAGEEHRNPAQPVSDLQG